MKDGKIIKKIISSIALFVFILAFVKIFEACFGKENSLVGVTVLIAILVLLQEDLTVKPVNNFFSLLILSEFLGIFSHYADMNPYLGIALNFSALFTVGYLLSFKMDKVLIVPFGLQYLFMLYTPVSGRAFALRLAGLAAGTVIIMISQIMFNLKKDKTGARPKIFKDQRKDEHIYRTVRFFKRDLKLHYIRGSYALRVGLVTAFCAFIVSALKLEDGRWIVYTVFSLTELYTEYCQERSRQRLEGTVIGTLIILFLFLFIKENHIRALLILAGGYADNFSKNYRQKMICVTVSVVASVSLINGTLVTAMERVGFVSVGIIIALVFDRLVFNRSKEDFIADNI